MSQEPLLSVAEIEAKIEEYSIKISSNQEEVSQRAKKRIFQKLGKLKKDLILAKEKESSNPVSVQKEVPNKRSSSEITEEASKNESDLNKNEDPENPEKKIKSELPILSRKENKAALHSLCRELADCAVKKQLTKAKKAVKQAEKKGVILDTSALSNFLNVYVRCLDIDGAEALYLSMKENKNISLNSVINTTLLKGYCEAGLMSKATQFFFMEMLEYDFEKDHSISKQNSSISKWNLRSLSTYLRGCMRTGWIESAVKSFNICFDMLDRNNLEKETHKSSQEFDDDLQNSSIYESLVSLLCKGGRLKDAINIVFKYIQLKSNSNSLSSVLENAGLYTILAKTNCFYGILNDSRKYITLAQNMIDEANLSGLKDTMKKKLLNQNTKETNEASKSTELFQAHRRNELKNELELLEDYINMIESSCPSEEILNLNLISPNLPSEKIKKTEYFVIQSCRSYLLSLHSLFYFGFDGRSDYEQISYQNQEDINNKSETSSLFDKISGPKELKNKLIYALKAKYGLNSKLILDLIQPYIDHLKTNNFIEILLNLIENENTLDNFYGNFFDENKNIKFNNLFSYLNPSKKNENLPVKVEICSGNGDWVAAQAAAERFTPNFEVPGSVPTSESENFSQTDPKVSNIVTTYNSTKPSPANWLSLELRYDRCYNILSNNILTLRPIESLFQNSLHLSQNNIKRSNDKEPESLIPNNNLAILCGDAHKIIENHFSSSSVDSFFINYPQPPDRITGNLDVNQGKHLLTDSFLKMCIYALKTNGTLTLLTDNFIYAQNLAANFAKINNENEEKYYSKLKKMKKDENSNEKSENKEEFFRFISLNLPENEHYSIQEKILIYNKKIQLFKQSNEKNMSRIKEEGKNVNSFTKKSMPYYFKDSVNIYRGDPDHLVGHTSSTSSYFDRLWSHGQKKRRWFIYLQKVAFKSEE